MRRPPYHRDRRDRLEVKMTPMIDVIFLLLIFFVLTASFQSFQQPEQLLPSRLSWPGSVASEAPVDPELEDLEEIVVKIFWRHSKPAWRINRRNCNTLEEVGDVLVRAKGVQADLPVILDVESDVPLENVIDVYDLCRRIGLERIQFAASVTA